LSEEVITHFKFYETRKFLRVAYKILSLMRGIDNNDVNMTYLTSWLCDPTVYGVLRSFGETGRVLQFRRLKSEIDFLLTERANNPSLQENFLELGNNNDSLESLRPAI